MLLANVYEGTKMMNKLVFDMGNSLELENTNHGEWVDVYINQEYYGNYLLTEKIGVDCALQKQNSKLNQEMLEEGNMELSDLLVEDEDMKAYQLFKNPSNLTGTNLIEKTGNDIRNIGFYTKRGMAFEVRRPDNASREEAEYMKQYVQNDDANFLSMFYYKKSNEDKLYAGPLWDHDGCFGEGDTC